MAKQKTKAELIAENSELQRMNNNQYNLIQNLKKDNIKVDEENNLLKEKTKDLNKLFNDNIRLSDKNISLSNDNNRLINIIDTNNIEINAIDKMKSVIEQKNKTIFGLQKEIEVLNKNNKGGNATLKSIQKENEKLIEENLNLKAKNLELGNMYAGSLEVYMNQTVVIDAKNAEIKKLKDEITYLKGFDKKEPITQTFDGRTHLVIKNGDFEVFKEKPTPPQSRTIKEGQIPSVPKSERYNIEENSINKLNEYESIGKKLLIKRIEALTKKCYLL